MSDINDLKQKRSRLIREGQDLYDMIAKEGRALTAMERDLDDARFDEIKDLSDQIDTMDGSARAEAGLMSDRRGTRRLGFRSGPTSVPGFRELRADEPAYRPGTYAKGTEEIDIARVVRCMVTGDASRLSREERDLVGNTGSGSLVLPQSITDRLIDQLRAQSVLLSRGARTVRLEDRIFGIPRWTSDPVSSWVAEGRNAIPESTPTVERVDLRPKTVAALVELSEELFQDSPDLGSSLLRAIAGALAAEIDRVGFIGDGASEPRGIFNDDDVSHNSSFGAASGLSYDTLIDALSVLEANNINVRGRRSRVSILMGDNVANQYDKKKDGNGQYVAFPDVPILQNKEITVSTNMGDRIMVGEVPQLVYGIRRDVTIDVSKEAGSNFNELMVSVRGFARCDWAVQQPSAFRLISGITGL